MPEVGFGGILLVDLDPIAESGRGNTFPSGREELGSPFDRRDPAPELAGEDDGRAAFAGRDVEYLGLRPEPEALTEKADLLRTRRVLDLVIAFGDGVVPGHRPAAYDPLAALRSGLVEREQEPCRAQQRLPLLSPSEPAHSGPNSGSKPSFLPGGDRNTPEYNGVYGGPRSS